MITIDAIIVGFGLAMFALGFLAGRHVSDPLHAFDDAADEHSQALGIGAADTHNGRNT
jgi:hypothetical protein